MIPVPEPKNISTKKNPIGRFMVAVGGVIQLKKTGKILVLKRSDKLNWQPGMWEIPYGRIDQFEEPQTGLRRELKEETGLVDIKIGEVLYVWHLYRGSKLAKNEVVGITYKCVSNSSAVILSDEHQAYQWVKPSQALILITEAGIKRDIKLFMESNK